MVLPIGFSLPNIFWETSSEITILFGSLSAMFLNMIGTTTDDGGGSWTFVGTEDLVILEGIGIYAPFAGGSIHMVDVLKFNAVDGTYIEHCFCHVSH